MQQANIGTDTSKIEKLSVNGMEFVSISEEVSREYDISDKYGNIHTIKILAPLWLFVRPSGSHMVIDYAGYTHYVSEFLTLRWLKVEGTQPANF
jgi:hypothetical protein